MSQPFKCLWEKKNGPGAGRCSTQCATCAQMDQGFKSAEGGPIERPDVTGEGVERGAAALYGELAVLPEALADQEVWHKARLRLAVRRIMAAVGDPTWGRHSDV